MKVYISGPITGLHPDTYHKAFADRADWARTQGWEPVNPALVDPGDGCICDNNPDHTQQCYMRANLRDLLRCDAITTLPGWQGSNGARAEVFVAAVAGLTFVEPAGGDVPGKANGSGSTSPQPDRPASAVFNPAYRVARCGQQSAHGPHVMEHGPDQPRNCPGTGTGRVQ